MQLNRQITMTPENDEYVSLLWKVSGMGSNDIINAAIDAKRKQDAALIEDIKALAERVKKHLSNEPKIVFDENGITVYKDGTPSKPALANIETPEKPKRKGGRPRKSVNQFVEEVHQADKMSKDEFVEYFGGKG